MMLILIIVLLFMIPLRYKNNESKPAAKEECEIFMTLAGSNEQMLLEQYLMGVLAGEMPASFHMRFIKQITGQHLFNKQQPIKYIKKKSIRNTKKS